MIIQHPMLWCAVALMAGIAVGLNFPSTLCLPLLVAVFVACYLTRKTRHLHDVLALLVWGLLGCSRASIGEGRWIIGDGKVKIENRVASVQSALTARLERSGVSPRTLALCSALVVGRKDGLKRETRQAYNRAGAGHLLALSGMHLGIIYGLMYLVFIRLVRFSKWRWHALPLVLLALWGYTLVAGMPVSLVRAALMLSLMTAFSLMEYDTDPLHPLALAAIIVLLISPRALLSVSFQLSFTAVFFILALWRPLSDKFQGANWAVRLLMVSCIASFGTMPLVAYYFHQVSLVGPLFSLILIPLTTVIIYLTIAAMVLPVAPLGALLNHAEAIQNKVVALAGSIPGGVLTDVYPSKLSLVLVYGVMLVAIVRFRSR
ncbi:MAG: ComEC/Rec2 family competence protein [Bacteroidaceae bacterium]|nr:ComEC/Rec2 family competence protein [Bacteroidaceae bacterium]